MIFNLFKDLFIYLSPREFSYLLEMTEYAFHHQHKLNYIHIKNFFSLFKFIYINN